MTKTNFILSQPATNSAAETVRNGAKLGLKFSVAYVYTVRANAKRMSRDAKPEKLSRVRISSTGHGSTQWLAQKDAQLRQLFGEIGLARSREIVDSIERAFA